MHFISNSLLGDWLKTDFLMTLTAFFGTDIDF